MDMNLWKDKLEGWLLSVQQTLFTPDFYYQLTALLLTLLIAWYAAYRVNRRLLDSQVVHDRQFLQTARKLIFPIFNLTAMAMAIGVLASMGIANWLLKIAQSWSVIMLIFFIVRYFVTNDFLKSILLWVGIPLATLTIFDLLSPTIQFLESISFSLGDFHLSLYAVLRLLIFGAVLFWLGSLSNRYGQQIIRNKEQLDLRTREVFAKLFQIVVFVVVFLLLLQVVGIDLTALAVFGGALGVGIGFGLQQIASNFISGLIILLDKSIAIGNYIEMEDGKAGILRKLDMRSSSLETFDGKFIVVPNEKFITSAFTNWTHDDPRQRYTLTFSVAYDSDIPSIPKLILDAISKHPQVLLEPELPDCEIIKFADSSIEFQLEYWINGIDDGKNRVGSDLLMIIWQTLHDNQISIPFPQREVRILNAPSQVAGA